MARMSLLTLPEGAPVELPEGEPVGSALPPGAVAALVDGVVCDLSFVPSGDVAVEPVDASSRDGLQVLRHSAAHVLAQAVCDLYAGAQYATGPAVEDGFFYDFALPSSVSSDDLPRIE